MKYIKLFESFEDYDPYELMITPPHKKAEMLVQEIKKSKSNLNLVSDLITLGANLEWEDESNNNFTILHYCAWKDKPIIGDLVIKAGANVDAQDKSNRTPLHICATYNRVEFGKLLLDSGCNPNLINIDGESPLHFAVNWNRKGIVELLLKYGANPNIQDNLDMSTPLHKAMHEYSTDIPKMLLDAGADTELKNSFNHTAEYLARFNGYSDIWKLINKYKKTQ
jgi:ankyrin repeat protein